MYFSAPFPIPSDLAGAAEAAVEVFRRFRTDNRFDDPRGADR